MRGSARKEPLDTKAELNLAPLVDCFTVLIAYLLVGASLVTYVALDTEVAAPSATAGGNATEPTLVVRLVADGSIRFEGSLLERAPSLSSTLPARSTGGLERWLSDARVAVPSLHEMVIVADAGVPYRRLVDTIASSRRTIPKLYLQGLAQ